LKNKKKMRMKEFLARETRSKIGVAGEMCHSLLCKKNTEI
jgi:hypothetical protein